MKVIVAGANGLIGKALVRALRARGDEVALLVRHLEGTQEWAPGATALPWDGRSPGLWERNVDGADAVINLAGASVAGKRWSPEYKKQILESRTQSTAAIVGAIRKAVRKPRVLVNASAVGYYGARGTEPLDESAAPGTDFLAGVVKAWEEAARCDALGVRTVMVRTGVVLAREGGALQQMVPPFRAFVGGPIGSGAQWFPWIHLTDEVAVFLWALDHDDLSGPVNAVAPHGQTSKEFSRTLGKVLHRPSWAPLPAAALKVILGEFATVLTEGQNPVPAALVKSGFQFRFTDSEAALADLLVSHAARPAPVEARP